MIINEWNAFEHIVKDPKDDELYLRRMKSGEILMEVRRETNAQIVLQT